jgi:hypothetical protein
MLLFFLQKRIKASEKERLTAEKLAQKSIKELQEVNERHEVFFYPFFFFLSFLLGDVWEMCVLSLLALTLDFFGFLISLPAECGDCIEYRSLLQRRRRCDAGGGDRVVEAGLASIRTKAWHATE